MYTIGYRVPQTCIFVRNEIGGDEGWVGFIAGSELIKYCLELVRINFNVFLRRTNVCRVGLVGWALVCAGWMEFNRNFLELA